MYWGHEFDLSGSRDIIGHVTDRLVLYGPFPIGGPLQPASISNGFRPEIFNGKCDTMADMTLNDL